MTHAQSEHIFTIRGMESQKLISHAKSLIAGSYGNAAHIQVACPLPSHKRKQSDGSQKTQRQGRCIYDV